MKEMSKPIPKNNDDARTEYLSDSITQDIISSERKNAQETGLILADYAKTFAEHRREDFEGTRKTIEDYNLEVEELRGKIDEKKSNLIRRIIDYKEISGLEKKLGIKENTLSSLQEEQRRRKESMGYYEEILAAEEALGKIMEKAQEENVAFDEKKRAELMEEEKRRSVGDLVKKHQVFFVHSFVVGSSKPDVMNSAINTKGLQTADQLDIVLGLYPTISASTISPDSEEGVFGQRGFGVLLSGGRVIAGSSGDSGSMARGRFARSSFKSNRKIEKIDEAIERTEIDGSKNKGTGYNEIILEKPEVAGTYFVWWENLPKIEEGKDIFLRDNEVPGYGSWSGWWEGVERLMKTGAPIFVLEKSNNVRMVYDINITARSFKVTPRYAPEDLIDMPGIYKQHLMKGKRTEAIARVMERVPNLLTEEEKQEAKKIKGKEEEPLYVSVY